MGKILLWIIGGTLLAVGAFFIPEQSGEMWPSVFFSSSVILAYLALFSFVWLRKISSHTKRKAIGWTLVLLIVGSGASAALSYHMSQSQKETIATIRSTIEKSIIQNRVRNPLLKTLRAYSQGERGTRDMESLFKAEYDSLLSDEGVLNNGSDTEDQTLSIYLAKASADSLVLIGESTYLEGKEPGFQNYSGATGHYQVKGILTSKGIEYERAN